VQSNWAILPWCFVIDKQLRGNIVEMVRQPLKTARAFYQDKRDTYAGNGPNGIEGTYYAAGEDGASLVMFLVGGNIGAITKIADKVAALPRWSEPAVREWNKDLDDIKHHSEVDLDGISSDAFYKYFQDGNFTDAEIEGYLKFAGDFDNPIDQKKLKSNPSLAVLWKKNNDGDPDFCALSLTSGTTPVEIRSSGCDGIDLESMIKKLPDPETPEGKAFMDKFNQLFFDEHFDADGILDLVPTDRADKFLKDLQNEGDDFLQKFVDDPDLMEAWDKIYPHENKIKLSVLQRRKEFDNFLPEWRKTNPYTGEEMFDSNSGGYIVSHNGHNDYVHEYDMAKAFSSDGNVVKLRDESVPDPNFGNKTPDAEISGIVHDFKTFDSPNNVNGKVYNHIIASGSRSNAPGVSFNLQGNNASLIDVNQGLDDVRLLIDNTGVPSGMAEQVGLVYSDGSVKFLSKNDIINGAYF